MHPALLLAADKNRIQSIDLLRGLVMIIMALDHTRDFFHNAAFTGDPLDPASTTPMLYFTRWITHLCAPTFVFLSGVSAWLQSRRKTTKELSIFLITRGAWLILIEITVITLGISADIGYGLIILQTIWSIGISMMILGLTIWLPYPVILSIALLIIFGHNLLDFAEAQRNGNVPVWWNFLHRPNIIPLSPNHSLGIFYPFLPWAGLMMLGYCMGKLFTHVKTVKRNRILLWSGLAALLLFVVLRFANVYGDPGRWTDQGTNLRTFFSFMNVQKYPPSLLFMCATIGIALIFLGLAKNTASHFSEVVSIYGRVPFFYYILHFYVLHSISVILYLTRGHGFTEGLNGVPNLPFKFAVPGEGYSLVIVYGVWIMVVILLYPLCKWYDAYKMNHKEKKWLSYL